jgi:large subunit ribosomal protein L3
MAFDNQGRRWPVTAVLVGGNVVTGIRTKEKDGYWAVQLGLGRKHIKKKAGKTAFLHIREVRVAEEEAGKRKVGEEIKAVEVFKMGDRVKVTGWTKGKGFAGGVKRWHFKGGPRTHGQSDRERAPGAMGMTTRPGRVFKGKRMAGRLGNAKRTVKNLVIEEINEAEKTVKIRGLVPGARGGLLMLEKG